MVNHDHRLGKDLRAPGARQRFLASWLEAVAQARRSRASRDFVVAADPLESDRVNVYEEWDSEEALLTFRGEGPGEDLSSAIVRADVARHEVASSGPPPASMRRPSQAMVSVATRISGKTKNCGSAERKLPGTC